MSLQEIKELENLLDHAPSQIQIKEATQILWKGHSFPFHTVKMGSKDPKAPCLILTGGMHGNEQIGAQVAINTLGSFLNRLQWDETFHLLLEKTKVLFVPIINPVGVYRRTRANENGVDLNRSSPILAEEKPPFLLGGHHYSPKLPYYGGPKSGPLQTSAKALFDFLKAEAFDSDFTLWIDHHSGFGFKDRLWFPYAKSKDPFPHAPEVIAFKKIFEESYPQNPYVIEPQSVQYTASGDLLDYIYLEQQKESKAPFLPFTLEMGSWVWVKKNPLQMFRVQGWTNPVKPHRQKRVLRRHLNFIEFAHRAVYSHSKWTPQTEARMGLLKQAPASWKWN